MFRGEVGMFGRRFVVFDLRKVVKLVREIGVRYLGVLGNFGNFRIIFGY